MNRGWSIARAHGFDLLVVVAAIASALEVALRRDAENAPQSSLWFAVPALALVVLLLLARHAFPFAAPAGVWVLAAAIAFVDPRLVPFAAAATLAGIAASFLLGNLPEASQARLGLAVTLGGAAIVVYNNPTHGPGDLLFGPLLFGLAWVGGFALRERARQAEAAELRAALAEREREAAARIAMAEERARIARELHDIVAHSVSVIVLQVGAVRHRLPSSLAEDKDVLRGVEETGRSALAEMRRLLGAMRISGQDAELAPNPGLDNIEQLLDDVGRSGLPVRLRIDGDALTLPAAIDLSAYRIVQEGLTNALKHASATEAEVLLSYGTDELVIEVRDDGRGGSGGDGLGHGHVGIRERVKIFGGEMSAGAAVGGGYVLRTRLPIQGGR